MTFLNILILIIFIIIVPNYNILLHNRNKHSEERFIKFLIIISLILIIVAPLFPFILTGKERIRDFVGIGEIGDTIGGITTPFISIAAVIVTGLAFYAQYKANDMVKKQFEIQKFENQFYEMLRLHKENVNEIEVENSGVKSGTTTKGRPAFLEMKNNLLKESGKIENEKQFKIVYKNFFWSNNFHSYLGHYYRHLYHTVKFVINQKEKIISEEQKLNYLRILRAQLSNYEQEMLFYNWLSDYGNDWEEISIEEKIIYYIINKKDMKSYMFNSLLEDYKKLEKKDEVLLSIIEKVNLNNLSDDDKKHFDKIKEESRNKNQFFTKYKMIQNLWYDKLSIKEEFIKDNLKILVKRYKELGGKNSLFEIGDNVDEKF